MMYIGRWAMTPPVTRVTPIQNAPTWPKVRPPNPLLRDAVPLDSMKLLPRASDRIDDTRKKPAGRNGRQSRFRSASRSCRSTEGGEPAGPLASAGAAGDGRRGARGGRPAPGGAGGRGGQPFRGTLCPEGARRVGPGRPRDRGGGGARDGTAYPEDTRMVGRR